MAQYTICEPPELPETCPEGFMPQLGSSDCVHIGDTCPVGDFPTVPNEITGDRIYVKAGSLAGDGDIASPFGNINDALASASENDVIIIAEGRYEETVEPQLDITLFGACVEKVIIDAPGPHGGAESGAIIVQGGVKLELRNLRISGAQNGVRIVGKFSEVKVKGLWIHKATRNGLLIIEGGILQAKECYVSEMQPEPEYGMARGMNAYDGAQVTIERGAFERNREFGIAVVRSAGDSRTELTMTDIVVRDTESDANGEFGYGMVVRDGVRVTIERGIFERNRGLGILSDSETGNFQTELTLTDLIVRDTKSFASGSAGWGIQVSNAARTSIERGIFERNRGAGIFASSLRGDFQAELTLTDIVVRDTESNANGGFGRGMSVQDGMLAKVERVIFERNREAGILASSLASDFQTELTLTDIVVRDIKSNASGEFGRGLGVEGGSLVTVERGVFERNRDFGIAAIGSTGDLQTEFTMTDLVVRDTKSNADGEEGVGMGVLLGTQAKVERGVFEQNRKAGIIVGFSTADFQTELTLTDILVRDTECDTNGEFGRGLAVELGSLVTVERGVFERNREIGVLAGFSSNDLQTELTMTDIVVRDTENNGNGEGGRGMSVQDGALAKVERGIFERNRGLGIFADSEIGNFRTELILTDLRVSNTKNNLDGKGGMGMSLRDGALATVERGIFEKNRGIGIFADSEIGDFQTELTLTDLVVRDTESDVNGELGRGLTVQVGARVTVERGIFERNREAGIFADSSESDFRTELSLTDLIVRDTESNTNGKLGLGIGVQAGAWTRVERGILERNRYVGILLIDDLNLLHADEHRQPASAELSNVLIKDTQLASCGEIPENEEGSSCIINGVNYGSGHGLVAVAGGEAIISDFMITGSKVVGLLIAREGIVEAHRGAITENSIGVNILDPDYEMSLLEDEIYNFDNTVDFARKDMALPDPSELIIPLDFDPPESASQY